MRVVLNSGPIIHLSWIQQLGLLHQIFDEVLIPLAVRDEVFAPSPGTLGLAHIQTALELGWLRIHESPLLRYLLPETMGDLDRGEAEAILLAEAIAADLFITDDLAARRVALARGLAVTGTLGVLRTARAPGLIPGVLPLLLELRRLGQWVHDGLVEQIRREESATGTTPVKRDWGGG